MALSARCLKLLVAADASSLFLFWQRGHHATRSSFLSVFWHVVRIRRLLHEIVIAEAHMLVLAFAHRLRVDVLARATWSIHLFLQTLFELFKNLLFFIDDLLC